MTMRILVVDDNIDSAESLAELLELESHQVKMAMGGLEALAAYRTDAYDLVFMDLKMPGMDGIETTRQIYNLNSKARVVVITGNTMKEDIEEVMELGVVGLLRKPCNIPELLAILEQEAGRLGA